MCISVTVVHLYYTMSWNSFNDQENNCCSTLNTHNTLINTERQVHIRFDTITDSGTTSQYTRPSKEHSSSLLQLILFPPNGNITPKHV